MDAEEEERLEVIDIDLNEESNHSSSNHRNIANTFSRIEERIRHLESVSHTMRSRQRQERRLSVEVVNEEPLSLNEETERAEVALHSAPVERLEIDRLKSGDNHLLALALDTDGGVREATQVKKNSGEAFFDCNICLGKARDPILTWCGHLYCWPCFYLLSNVGPETKQCPECKEDVNVTDSGIIPIFGKSDKAFKIEADKSGVTIPPRPRANRVESLRQQLITRVSQSSRSLALSSAERFADGVDGMAFLFQEFRNRYGGPFNDDSNSDVLVDVPSGGLVPNSNADTETDLPSSSTSIVVNEVTSASNGVHSQENFSDVTVPRSRRGRISTPFQQIQLPEQRQSRLRSRAELQTQLVQERSGVSQSEENPPDAPPLVDASASGNLERSRRRRRLR